MATILLIEDARDLADIVLRELERSGYETMHAVDGFEGLRLFQQGSPDLVILDWMLPGLDGIDVLRRIRECSALPVLMLTARDEETDRVIGLELGADDYMAKPFGLREMVARVRALLRRIERVEQIVARDRAPAEHVLTYGALLLDPQAYQATLNGQPLELTRTEFDLLCLFLRNVGRAFSRAYILDAVWGEHYVTGDRSVDNTVLRIRKKLGALGQALETVWGVGYRFRRDVTL